MMIPDDVGIRAFHGDAGPKATLLERLREYEAHGDTALKTAMLQREWNDQAKHGPVFNPYPKLVRAEDIAGIRMDGDAATLYALGAIDQRSFILLVSLPEKRIYAVNCAIDTAFKERLGVPSSLVSVLGAVSKGLPPERETSWLRQFWAAVPVGANLWQAPMRLAVWALSDPSYGILGLSNADAQGGETDRGIAAVRDFLSLYRNWQAGGRAERQDWFSFVKPAEDDVKSSQRQGDDGQYVYDLPAPVRFCLRAVAHAARAADVEEALLPPLPAGMIKRQLSADSMNAPGYAIDQVALYASDKGIAPSVWYEACAGVLLDILANCPIPEGTSG